MSGNWTTECSHLVMSSLTVTVKVVIYARIMAVMIVKFRPDL